MTEKIGTIKNPLTIIAIFAGIAEVSGTLVLPFIADENQLLFIYFLIVFPSVLIVVFFLTLNFNNKALYAPSDFQNEENYIKIFKYDESKKTKVEINVPQKQMLEILNENISEFKKSNDIKLQKLEQDITKLKTAREDNIADENFDEFDFIVENQISLLNLPNAKVLARIFSKKGYNVEYNEKERLFDDLKNHKSIWLGSEVSFDNAKEILLIAKEFYPHLKYISVSDNTQDVPEYVLYEVFIGGSTQTALEEGIKPLGDDDWKKIAESKSKDELYQIIGYKK
ncbi:hypothetical protein QYR09_07800 [Cellulophaga lytica]|nr:hypothetical protein QYR09_07800 [Cellulophaga lytica]